MNKVLLFILPELFGLSIEFYFIALLIAVPTFFFFKWVFKKIIKHEHTRKIATWLTTLLLVPVIYEVAIAMFFMALFYEPKRDFDSTKSITSKVDRYQMANSIIDSKILIRKDTNQVKQISGKPTLQDDFIKEWIYDMGMGGGGLGFLFHNLIFKFNSYRVTAVLHQEVKD
ncbi:MAG: hypothetical protein ACRYFL_08510 [Janthinobacterium lividum]